MKYLLMLVILTASVCGLGGCATTDSTAKGDPVPGEKTGDDARLQPGASGTTPSASLKW